MVILLYYDRDAQHWRYSVLHRIIYGVRIWVSTQLRFFPPLPVYGPLPARCCPVCHTPNKQTNIYMTNCLTEWMKNQPSIIFRWYIVYCSLQGPPKLSVFIAMQGATGPPSRNKRKQTRNTTPPTACYARPGAFFYNYNCCYCYCATATHFCYAAIGTVYQYIEYLGEKSVRLRFVDAQIDRSSFRFVFGCRSTIT